MAPAVSFPVLVKFPVTPCAVLPAFFTAPPAVPVVPFAAPEAALDKGADRPPEALSSPPKAFTSAAYYISSLRPRLPVPSFARAMEATIAKFLLLVLWRPRAVTKYWTYRWRRLHPC